MYLMHAANSCLEATEEVFYVNVFKRSFPFLLNNFEVENQTLPHNMQFPENLHYFPSRICWIPLIFRDFPQYMF